MVNSRLKGKREELRVVHWLRDNGFASARRSVQYCGRNVDSSDVLIDELPFLYIEVKSRKTQPAVNEIKEWLDVAAANCGDKIPILLVNVLRSREPSVYAKEPMLGGIVVYYTNRIETLIRLNQEAAAVRLEGRTE